MPGKTDYGWSLFVLACEELAGEQKNGARKIATAPSRSSG